MYILCSLDYTHNVFEGIFIHCRWTVRLAGFFAYNRWRMADGSSKNKGKTPYSNF